MGEETNLIDKELGELFQKQAIHLVSEHDHNVGFVSGLFVIPKKGGGQRPVFNLRQLNRFIQYKHFKMEGIHMLKDLPKPNDFMAKIDLKDAYFTVPIWKGHQKFLRFLWKPWEFACLPFGIASAPRVFTKILKPVIGLLRKQGIRLIIYLDGFLLIASTEETLTYHITLTVTLLEILGFVVNYQKSQLNPTQSIEFLGFRINSVTLNISLPLDKVKSIRRECQKVLENLDITIRELVLLLGKLSASIQAVFPAPLHYRHIQAVKKHSLALRGGYEFPVCWTEEALEELKWWRDFSAWNRRAILRTPTHLTIETHASSMGWGACCGNFQTRGLWSQSERLLHINCLKLLAGDFALKSFLKNKGNIHVKLTAISYIKKMGGSTPLILSSLALDLRQWCLNRTITVEAHHLPGRLNFVTDFESRAHPDSSDWKLEPSIFQGINNKWGPFTMGIFASRLTTLLPRFVS
ncbi:uncharacterized protein LOC111325067 [Stylophora pistillata]|uniref:uncharacterized protein LOC111325067 n=1 Tax=Stylophora pistillata TaxID=50429 RepID=UPI000C03B7D1|nr:uncharacterized protein LOC111325067 [Stylophora pistillata]